MGKLSMFMGWLFQILELFVVLLWLVGTRIPAIRGDTISRWVQSISGVAFGKYIQGIRAMDGVDVGRWGCELFLVMRLVGGCELLVVLLLVV